MPQKTYRKLVRDNVPLLIRKEGGVPKTRTLPKQEFRKALFDALVDEATQARDKWCFEDVVDELADLEEVIAAIKTDLNIDPKRFEELCKQRARVRGVFANKTFLHSVKYR